MLKKILLILFTTFFIVSVDKIITLLEKSSQNGKSIDRVTEILNLTGLTFICEKLLFCSELEDKNNHLIKDNGDNNINNLVLLNKEKGIDTPKSVKGVIKKRDTSSIDLSDRRDIYWIDSNKRLIDSIKEENFYETIPAFIDIVSAEARVNSEKIFAKIELLNYKALNLTSDSPEARKYQVEFYIKDNISIEIGFGIQTLNSRETLKYLYLNYKDGDNYDYSEYNNINSYVKVVGNSIIFNIPKSINAYLEDITPQSKVHFWTWYNIEDIDKSFYDNCPN